MVFSAIVLAISEASTLGRVSAKTIGWFMLTSGIALVLASIFGMVFFKAGVFSATIEGISISSGTTGSNPLNVILNIIPSNIISTFSVNNAVLGIVFIAVVVGLGMNKLDLGKDSTIYRFCDESNSIIVVFLNYMVTKFGPCAIFMLLCRTFATYGIDYLKPALAYFVICTILLLTYFFVGYPCILAFICKMNPVVFIRKIFGAIVFGFSTSSSAATLPMNLDAST